MDLDQWLVSSDTYLENEKLLTHLKYSNFKQVPKYRYKENRIVVEANCPSGEHRGLTVYAIVLRREFDSWVHLKTRWIRRTT